MFERLPARQLLVAILAMAMAAATAAIRVAVMPLWGSADPCTLFYPAIMLAAWYGGRRPGILATLLSAGCRMGSTQEA